MSISSVLNWCFGNPGHHVGATDDRAKGDGEANRGDRSAREQQDDRRAALGELQRQAYFQQLLRLTCADVMRKPPVTVTVDDTIGAALKVLDSHHIKLLPVVDAEGCLKGVVTHVDLQPLDAVLPFLKLASDTTAPESERRQRPVTTVMSRQVRCVAETTPLTDVIRLFTQKEGHHHLPVVDDDGRVVGVLTQADIMKIMCGQ
ncbi:CBS domain-containing protein [Paraburkholderia diazotrophica]|uniref:CBS domain-containing membrane protein n=1 Tax=Paraburkholderia diazotrophica TaxID=667676 RepID=A0A1H6ZY40_9BURK|nr:CBS domain-containing protein [Paraburkholderia diazotrophica]SEJ57556.1 CBS domain-containing membrane protein [Paraburkholderia diazotrophica]